MKWEEKHNQYPAKLTRRFKYFQKNTGQTTYYHRETRLWWKPMMFIGNKILRPLVRENGGKFHWWIRNHFTYD